MQFLALLSPAVATAIGWAALGQALAPVQLGGAALVTVAVVAGQRVGRLPRGRTRGDAPAQTIGPAPACAPTRGHSRRLAMSNSDSFHIESYASKE
jgi:probable blue pigment (indigoidine) exporter